MLVNEQQRNRAVGIVLAAFVAFSSASSSVIAQSVQTAPIPAGSSSAPVPAGAASAPASFATPGESTAAPIGVIARPAEPDRGGTVAPESAPIPTAAPETVPPVPNGLLPQSDPSIPALLQPAAGNSDGRTTTAASSSIPVGTGTAGAPPTAHAANPKIPPGSVVQIPIDSRQYLGLGTVDAIHYVYDTVERHVKTAVTTNSIAPEQADLISAQMKEIAKEIGELQHSGQVTIKSLNSIGRRLAKIERAVRPDDKTPLAMPWY